MSPILALLALTASPQSPGVFQKQFPQTQASPLTYKAIDTFFLAESEYRKGRYTAASTLIESFWKSHPPGTQEWVDEYRKAGELSDATGINVGRPPAYYALRMLTECVRWRAGGGKEKADGASAVMTVVLVGQTKGIEPRTREELDSRKGVEKEGKLEPALLQNKNELIHESVWLLQEYVAACTRGDLRVRTNVVHLPDLKATVEATWDGRGFSGLAGSAWGPLWAAVPEKARAETDWWWVIYPSAVPEQYPDFKTTEFVTGGMGSGPDGLSPCFIIDDRWLTRRPPHLGQGKYSELERRVYLPQWLQHEFFHHLYRIYPEFGLEKEGHDWFNRATWPKDFEGFIEPDYYDESMRKRMIGSTPSLASRLLYAPPNPALFKDLKIEDVIGEYQHDPVENDWHVGMLLPEPGSKSVLRWTNKAGVAWTLTPDLAKGQLLAAPGSPYYDANPTTGRAFSMVLQRDAKGRYLPKVAGFQYSGGFYRKK